MGVHNYQQMIRPHANAGNLARLMRLSYLSSCKLFCKGPLLLEQHCQAPVEGWHDLSISEFPSLPPYFHLICRLRLICPFLSCISHLVDLICPIRRHPASISSFE